jgi:hypothetical protein
MMAFIETLPPETQAQLKSLPDEQLEQEVMQMMKGQAVPQQSQPAQ